MASTRIAGAHVHATHLAPKSKFVPRGEEDIVPKDTATIVDWQPRRSRKYRDATNRTASFLNSRVHGFFLFIGHSVHF